MKKILMLSAVMGALVSASALANPANVTFNGNVTSTSCTVVAGSKAMELIIPDVTTKEIADGTEGYSLNAESPESDIEIVSCPPSVTSVNISSFSTTGIPGNNFLRTIPESGTGKGVEIVFSYKNPDNDNWANLGPGEVPSVDWVPDASGNTTITVKSASHKNSANGIVAGDYQTTYTLTFAWS